jgi:hypothetical protein
MHRRLSLKVRYHAHGDLKPIFRLVTNLLIARMQKMPVGFLFGNEGASTVVMPLTIISSHIFGCNIHSQSTTNYFQHMLLHHFDHVT